MKIANYNKNAYLNDWKITHRSYERSQYPNFKNALNKQLAPVVDYINRYGMYDLEIHLTVLVSAQPMQEAYLKCYTRIGVNHAEWMYNKISKIGQQKSIPSFFSEQWRKLMAMFYQIDGGKRITQVTQTTRESVMKVLSYSQALPISERATYMVDTLQNKDFNRNRALVIARTESTAAANKGAALGAESSDYEVVKQWLAVMDMNTRPTHKAANEQTVESDAYFIVGTEYCLYPGDLNLSAEEVINCRCCSAYIPMLSENGLPILKKL